MKKNVVVYVCLLMVAVILVPLAVAAEITMLEVTKKANIRETADANGKKITVAEAGSQYLYLGTQGKWYAVMLEAGVKGYVSKNYASLSPAAEMPAGSVWDTADEAFRTGLQYMAEEKYYSAREASKNSALAEAEDMAGLCAQPMPGTKELWHNEAMVSNAMALIFDVQKVNKSDGHYFLVYTEEGELASTAFVTGSGAVTLPLPGGRYRIREASGTVWYGEKEAFGREGHYENMVFNEIEGDDYLTDLEEGYAYTIAINDSTDNENSSVVDGDDIDWDSWSTGGM